MGDIGQLTGRLGGTLAAFAALLVAACANRPEAPPGPARPPVAQQEGTPPATATSAADPADDCTLVATVITAPLPALGGSSAIERPEAARARQPDGRLLVVVSKGAPAAPPSDPSAAGCGDRLVLAGPKDPISAGIEPFELRLSTAGEGALDFALVLGARGPSAVLAEGWLERDDRGEWRTANPSPKSPRPLDAAPVERALPESLAPGQALAWLELDTGSDVLSSHSKETGLALVVRLGARELRQVFASCPEGAKGSALGELAPDVLDLAACGDLYRLVRRESALVHGRTEKRLVVDKQLPDGTWQPSLTLALPPDIRTVNTPDLDRNRAHGG